MKYIVTLGKKFSDTHDTLRLGKDKVFVPLVRILPRWLKPNHVTIFRTGILIAWFPYAVWYPDLNQVFIFFLIYFFDLLDGAMARLRNQTTYFGGYLDHVSDKFSNIALLSVLYQTVGSQFLFFIFWDVLMAALLIVEGVSKKIELSYIRSPFEVLVRIVLWILILRSAIQMFF